MCADCVCVSHVCLRSYRWDSAKVREMLAKKRESGALPVNLTAEKARLQRLLDGEKGRQPPDYDKIAE